MTEEGGNPEDNGNWYDRYGITDEKHLSIVSRYKTENDAVMGLIEARQAMSKNIQPPDPSAPDYRDQLAKTRLKLGAKPTADEYTVNVPDDLKEALEKHSPEYIKSAKERAAKWGLTQAELDEAVEDHLKTFREELTEVETSEKAQKDAELQASEKLNEALTEVWGSRKEQQQANAALLAKHFDDTLFNGDNQNLSEEEIAEKGGMLAQWLKGSKDPLMWRLMSYLHHRMLGEGPPPPGQDATGKIDNVFTDRYEKAQAQWPNRDEKFWTEVAKDRTFPL